jgi:ribosomal protein L37AE/L43A
MKICCPVCEEKFPVAKRDNLRSYECPDCGTIFKLKKSRDPIVFTLPKEAPLLNEAFREAYEELRPDDDNEVYGEPWLDEEEY